MFLSERKFVKTAREQLLVLEAVWVGGQNSFDPAQPSPNAAQTVDQKIALTLSQKSLDMIFEQAMTVNALAVMRACGPCQEALIRIVDLDQNPSVLRRHLSVLKGLVEQYTDGLVEIDPTFAAQSDDTTEPEMAVMTEMAGVAEIDVLDDGLETETGIDRTAQDTNIKKPIVLACLQGRHVVASQTMRPLLPWAETSKQANALSTLISLGDEQGARLEAEQFVLNSATSLGNAKSMAVNSDSPHSNGANVSAASSKDAVLTLEILEHDLALPVGSSLGLPITAQASNFLPRAHQHIAVEYPVRVTFENMMRPITNLILGEARFLKKRVSISYGAEFDHLPLALANRVQEYLELLCLNIVLYGIDKDGSQIEITGQAGEKNATMKISWLGGNLSKISDDDLNALKNCQGIASQSSAALFEAMSGAPSQVKTQQYFEVNFAVPSTGANATPRSEYKSIGDHDALPVNSLAEIGDDTRRTG